jgi:hypothetical protein
MTDKDLLELAAKAAGVRVPPLNAFPWHGIDNGGIWTNTSAVGHLEPKKRKYTWAPLTDDGAALRLAVNLLFEIDMGRGCIAIRHSTGIKILKAFNLDPYAATRRAIVMAAAEIGKGME